MINVIKLNKYTYHLNEQFWQCYMSRCPDRQKADPWWQCKQVWHTLNHAHCSSYKTHIPTMNWNDFNKLDNLDRNNYHLMYCQCGIDLTCVTFCFLRYCSFVCIMFIVHVWLSHVINFYLPTLQIKLRFIKNSAINICNHIFTTNVLLPNCN